MVLIRNRMFVPSPGTLRVLLWCVCVCVSARAFVSDCILCMRAHSKLEYLLTTSSDVSVPPLAGLSLIRRSLPSSVITWPPGRLRPTNGHARRASMVAPSVEENFQRLLQDVREGMPDEESAAQIITGFQRHWDKPPLKEIEMLLQRTTNLHDARLLLFFPEPVDMIRFVTLIQRAPTGAPPEHPQNKVRVPFLALLYMQHVKNWPLMRAFIQEGGLRALADSFADDNIYLRAQAVDTMMQLTNTELHDWFKDPAEVT
jgi:hypothetical protein